MLSESSDEVIVRDPDYDDAVREEWNHFGFDAGDNLIVTKAIPKDIHPLKAMRLSIAKWEMLVMRLEDYDEVQNDGGILTCALCAKYYNDGNCKILNGSKCPISMATNNCHCACTPYSKFSHIDRDDIDARLEWAKRELRFLQGIYEMMRCIWQDEE
jgi:hypothetical protein